MRKSTIRKLAASQLFTVLICLILVNAQAALDPPHTGTVGCLSCHQMTSTYPKLLPLLGGTTMVDIDDTLANRVCRSCHTGPPDAIYMQETHSSLKADNGYGNWTVECWVCHNQHIQEQERYNGSTYGKYIRRAVNLANITGLTKTGTKNVKFTGNTGGNSFADGDPTAIDGICEVCHTQTSHFRNNGAGTDQNHGNLGDLKGTNCTLKCHTHINGFIHGGGNSVCETCHNSGSHTTHISSTSAIGPRILCHSCHDLNNMPSLKSGSDGDADGKYSLTETDVCDSCHSSGGAYDGVNDAIAGAKPNWASGIYSGPALAVGKEKWCVTCHDSGTSVISGRQAPDVAGDNVNYGYYVSGHGRTGAAQECSACHGLTMSHNFDGKKTYAGALDNYTQGFRLADVNGMPPLDIPLSVTNIYNASAFNLCLDCHSGENLLSDTKSHGCYDNTSNPYKNAAAITTQFRNTHSAGHDTGASDIPANFHADHLIDVNSFSTLWYSDGPGVTTGSSGVSCPTCHNPHGDRRGNGSATIAMTVGAFEMVRGSDAYGQYGEVTSFTPYTSGNPQQRCSMNCHWDTSVRWYYNAAPTLNAIAVADSNNADPAPAEAGFTNNAGIAVTLTSYGDPTEIMCAEDVLFTVNPSAWTPYVSPFTYTLSPAQGGKSVYCKTRNAYGESAARNASITLDTIPPTMQNTTLTSPNGAEVWAQGTSNTISWTGGDIMDTNLKTGPLTFAYSTDSGATFPNTISSGEANDGTSSWLTPLINQSTVRVRMTATDKAGNQASDPSNGDFTIQAVSATIDSFTVSDSNPANPASAEAGYSNDQVVNVTVSASNYPTEMRLAEDAAFSQNSTGWLPYSTSTSYTLSGGEGSTTVWLQLRNAAGESGTSSYAIILDTTAPGTSIPLNTLLTAPNGGELWQEGETNRQITWDSTSISDTNLKPNPITLEYSVDSGSTYPYIIASDDANDGSHPWNPIPKPASYTALVRLKITDRAGNQAEDISDVTFIIQPPAQYIVTNTGDSGPGSLRQAITDLVAAGGNDSIWFNISSGLTSNVAIINLATVLPSLSAPNMTIDGGSQAVLSGIVNPRGPAVRLHGNTSFNGFNITADSVTVKKLQLTNFYFYAISIEATGTHAAIEGNHIGFRSDSATNYTAQGNYYGMVVSAADCRIGGSGIEQRNFISGNFYSAIYLNTASRVTIDNNLIGLRPDGADLSNGTFYDAIYAAYPHNGVIRNNMISGSSSGIFIAYTDTLTITGNIFGLYFDGATWYSRVQQDYAIRLGTSSLIKSITIGGPNVATSDSNLNDSNVFSAKASGSGATGSAISVYHNIASPTKIYGNFIGTNPEQDEVFPGRIGVYVSGYFGSNTVVGGGGAWEAGNVIANMTASGTYLVAGANQVKISRNSFYNNGSSAAGSDDAIFLEGTANNDITRPSITSANTSTVTVEGVASGDVVQVYLSDYDGSGSEFGEGKTFIGSVVASGSSADVDVSGAGIGSGVWVTALRKDASNNTSTFSANVQVP